MCSGRIFIAGRRLTIDKNILARLVQLQKRDGTFKIKLNALDADFIGNPSVGSL